MHAYICIFLFFHSFYGSLVKVCDPHVIRYTNRALEVHHSRWSVPTEAPTHLSGNALHHHSGYRSDSAPLRVIKWALGMIQAGQGTDLVLGISGLVGGLKEGQGRREKQNKSINLSG